MATFEIRIPGQGTFEVGGVDTEEEALAQLQRKLGGLGRPEAPSGVMQGLRDLVNAPAQLLSEALPAGVTERVNALNNWLADQGLPLERLGEGGVSQQIAEQEQAYQQARQAAGEEGVDWGRIGGNVGGTLAGGWASGISRLLPQAASLGGRLAQGAGIGAATGALTTPVTGGDDFWTQKAIQTGIGAGAGAAGEAVIGGLGALGRNAGRADVRALQAEGVEPTIGQAMGGMASRTEEKLGSIPLLGDAIGAARQRAQDQWILAAERRAMEGLPGDVTEIGQRGIQQMQNMANRAYREAEQLAPGGILLNRPQGTATLAGPGTQPITAGQEIMQLTQNMRYATGDARRAFSQFMRDKFGPRLGRAQGFDPVNFKELDSELSTAIAKSEGQAQDAFRELRNILRSAAADQNPAYAQALNVADRAYANLVRLEAAANRTAAKEGVFTPGQLQLAAKYSDRSVRHRQAAAGEAPMQDIANLGQRVLGDRVPTSGTTERAMTAGLAGGGALVDPLTTAMLGGGLYLGGQALWSPMAQRLLVRALQGAGSIPQGLGGAIGGTSLYPDLTGR
jgi:hypothetical protein